MRYQTAPCPDISALPFSVSPNRIKIMPQSEQFRAPRGVADILPPQQPAWEHIRAVAASTAEQFGYRRIDTPIFEATGLFRRGVGTETDIVQKEMYTFQDLGGDDITLRPEGTAPVCRAYIEHGMHNLPQPVRLYYVAPMFRYERPQSGRFRQHHQFGCEAIGDPSPFIDAEVIEVGWRYITTLGIEGVTVRINSIGDGPERASYCDALTTYFSRYEHDLPKVDQDRLRRTPLRLLDSKEPVTRRIGEDAPKSLDYLSEDAAAHWERLLELLEGMKSAYPSFRYELDHALVRGLDYYNRTVFEFQPNDVTSQSSLFGGGRYDPLIELIGGNPTPAVGFGSGIERIIGEVATPEDSVAESDRIDVVTVSMGDAPGLHALHIAALLRNNGLSVSSAPAGRSVRSNMRYANQSGARYALILGQREVERGVATLKPLRTDDDQFQIALNANAIAARIKARS